MVKETFKAIFPQKKINRFILFIMTLGFLSGSIFLSVISKSDKAEIVKAIKSYFKTIGAKNCIDIFKNSCCINFIYIIVIFILSMSLLGIFINIFILYFKSFTLGFTITSIIYSYKIKGIIYAIIYLIFGEVFSLCEIMIMTIYSTLFVIHIFRVLLKRERDTKLLKKYFIILLLCICITTAGALIKCLILPRLIKIVGKFI